MDGLLDKEGKTEAKYRRYNYGAALFGQASRELDRWMELLGGKPETARELAGVGDMFVTSHRAALEKLTGRGIVREEDFPLMRHLYAVVGKDEPLDMPWKTFFGGEAASAS